MSNRLLEGGGGDSSKWKKAKENITSEDFLERKILLCSYSVNWSPSACELYFFIKALSFATQQLPVPV